MKFRLRQPHVPEDGEYIDRSHRPNSTEWSTDLISRQPQSCESLLPGESCECTKNVLEYSSMFRFLAVFSLAYGLSAAQGQKFTVDLTVLSPDPYDAGYSFQIRDYLVTELHRIPDVSLATGIVPPAQYHMEILCSSFRDSSGEEFVAISEVLLRNFDFADYRQKFSESEWAFIKARVTEYTKNESLETRHELLKVPWSKVRTQCQQIVREFNSRDLQLERDVNAEIARSKGN